MSEFWMLDIRTLAFSASVSGFLMALTMLGMYLAGMRIRALIDWSLAGLSLGLGFLAGHLLQTVGMPMPAWAGASLANSLIALGHGMVLVGVQRYLGRPSSLWLVLVCVLAIALSSLLIDPVRESLRARVILHSGWYVAVNIWAGALLWRFPRLGMASYVQATAVILWTYALLLTLRLAYAVISPALTDSFVRDPFQVLAFVASMIYGFFLAMALAVMMFREAQIKLMDVARRDPLTGMNNRLSMGEAADTVMSQAAEHREPLSLMLIDLDYFKQFNDQLGHQAGDLRLQRVAERIAEVVRSDDLAFRFGGEEFLVMLPGAELTRAVDVAERLRSVLAGDREAGAPWQTVSIGVVQWQAGQESWEQLVHRADEALYRAKRQGRNRVVAEGEELESL